MTGSLTEEEADALLDAITTEYMIGLFPGGPPHNIGAVHAGLLRATLKHARAAAMSPNVVAAIERAIASCGVPE